MSILPILGQTEQPVETLAFMLGAVGVAGGIIAATGALRPRSVVGPARLDAHESPAPIWFMLLLGICVWNFVPAIYVQAKLGFLQNKSDTTTKPTSQQITLEPREQVELTLAGGLFGLGVLIAGNAVARHHALRKMGLSRQSLVNSVIPIAISVAAVIPIMYLAQYFTQVLWDQIGMDHPDAHPLLEIFKDQVDPGLRALVVGSAILLAPTFEELLFRGHMQTAIAYTFSSMLPAKPRPRGFEVIQAGQGGGLSQEQDTRLSSYDGPSTAARWAAIFLTSLAFALVHAQIWMMPPIFVLSICLGYAYERTGNLWVPIGIHAAFNTANIAYFIFLKLAH